MAIKQFNARLPEETIDLIKQLAEALAEKVGLPNPYSQADVMAMAIRRMADAELPPEKKSKKSGKRD